MVSRADVAPSLSRIGLSAALLLPASLALVGGGALARPDGTFVSGRSVRLHASASALVVADFDRNGVPDVALAHDEDASVSVLRGNRHGGLVARPDSRFAVGSSPVFLAVGDLDQSAGLDLVVVNSGSASLSVLLDDGAGGYLPSREVALDLPPRMARLGDLDGDGDLDVVTNDFVADNRGALTVLLGDGAGGLRQETVLAAGDNTHSFVLVDFDADGWLDIVAAHRPSSRTLGLIDWYAGRGDGSFAPFRRHELGPVIPRFVEVVDAEDPVRLAVLADTGLLMLVSPDENGGLNVNSVATTRGTRLIAVADVDGDGAADLAAPYDDGFHDTLRVFAGPRGAGLGASHEVVLSNEATKALGFADLDADGSPEAIVAVNGPDLMIVPGRGGGEFAARAVLSLPSPPKDVVILPAGARHETLLVVGSQTLHVVSAGAEGLEATALVESATSAFNRAAAGRGRSLRRDWVAVTDLAVNAVRVFALEGGARAAEDAVHVFRGLPGELAAVDLDSDGADDLVVSERGTPSLLVMLDPLNEASPKQRWVTLPAPALALAVGNVDGEMPCELLAVTETGVTVLFGARGEALVHSRTIAGTAGAGAAAVGDLDADGQGDVVVAAGDTLRAFLAPTGNTERPPLAFQVGETLRALAVGDVDADGIAEIVVATRSHLIVTRHRSGGFDEPERYPAGSFLGDVALGDFDGDGVLDAVAADPRTWSLTMLPGQRPVTLEMFRRGDVDLDTRVRITDAVAILLWLFRAGTALSCPDAGDVNDDGRVSISDAVLILDHLFRGGRSLAPPGPDRCGMDRSFDLLDPCADGCIVR